MRRPRARRSRRGRRRRRRGSRGSRPARPRPASRPRSSTWMRSQTSMISAMLWSIRSTPAPWSSRTARTTAANSGTSASGRPAAGSSMSTKLGSMASARATPRRRSSPCASAPARRCPCAAEAEQRQQLAGPPARLARRRRPTPSAATSTFSRTVRSRNDLECWNVRASPARPRRCGLQLVISRPSSSIAPEVGKSNPVIRFTSVDLPAPFGPIRPTTSCCRSSSVTSSSACTPSNERETERARSVPCGARLSDCSGRVARLRAAPAVAPDDTRGHRGSCQVARPSGRPWPRRSRRPSPSCPGCGSRGTCGRTRCAGSPRS